MLDAMPDPWMDSCSVRLSVPPYARDAARASNRLHPPPRHPAAPVSIPELHPACPSS